MSKIASYLRKNLQGEVIITPEILEKYSKDSSIFEVSPQLVIYPRNALDVRKLTKISWQLAEQGKSLPITARGLGSDQSGAALGSGIVVVFPAHMNKLIELNSDKNYVRVEPGMLYSSLQTTLYSHGRFLPPAPVSKDYSTIGGALANNASGQKTVKYGDTKAFTSELEIVLSNGDLITTKRLSKRELNRKKGLTNFEGEIYRQLDGLLTDNQERIKESKLNITKNATGYNISDVKRRDGSFDLTPLFVGAQGTLGVITSAKMKIVKHQPKNVLCLISFDNLEKSLDIVPEIIKLSPSAIEFIDGKALDLVNKHHSNALNDVFPDKIPPAVLLVEFDDEVIRTQHRKTKKLSKILGTAASEIRISHKLEEINQFWQVREALALLSYSEGTEQALPLINDAVVSPDKISLVTEKLSELAKKYSVTLPMFGNAGDGNIHVIPFFNLSSLGDRQRMFKLSDEYYKFIIENGGSITGQIGDGRINAPYLEQLYGPEVYKIFCNVKEILDPHNIFNPGVKINVSRDDIIGNIKQSHNPRII